MSRASRQAVRALAAALALSLGFGLSARAAVAQEVTVEELEAQAAEPLAPPPSDEGTAPGQPMRPATPEQLEAAAEARYLEGDLAGAAALYREAAVATSEPLQRMRRVVAAAWIEHQLGRYTDALDLLSQGLADVADFPFQAQNYSQEFVDLYERALAKAGAERRARAGELVQRSLREIAGDELPRARATLQQALAITPEDPFALFNLALVEMRSGQREEALAGFERLVALDAARPGAVPPEVKAPALASLGLLYYEKDYFEDARRYLEQSTAIDPGAARTWNNLGLTLRRLGDAGGAETAFRRALTQSPGDPQVANNLALVLLAAERHGEAVTLLEEVTRRAPEDAPAWLNLGLARRGAGDRSGAAAALDQVVALDAGNRRGMAARAATYLAVVRFEQGDASGAAAAARQALAWNPTDVEAWVYQGLALHGLDDPAGARDAFQEAARLDPTRPEIHNNLGTALVALGDLAAAEAAFRQALAIEPGFADARANLDQVVAQRALDSGGDAAGTSQPRSRPPAVRVEEARPARRNKPLGATFSDEDFSYLGIRGAMVESVLGESPAARAGLRKGDLVLGADGEQIDGPQQLLRYIAGVQDKDYVELDVLRDGRPRRLRVEIY